MTRPTIYDLVQSPDTISSEYAKNPEAPGKIKHRLYGKFESKDPGEPPENLGNFGPTQPSPLFHQIYHSILRNMQDPMAGMVSPPLLSSYGVVPLTIIAPLSDIVRHMSNCIVRAKKEVFLATNFWINSESSKLITDAFRELSRRVGERGGEKVIVKVLYDRGNVKQVVENHQHVPPSEYSGSKVAIPPPSEVPNIDIQVVNYHVPLLGTFHSKFMVVDREMGLLMSNNIQDNDNLEMCSRLEGPIIDSLYDVCLASWSTELNPPLPCRDSPATGKGFPSYDDPTFLALFTDDAHKESVDLPSVVRAGHDSLDLPEHTASSPHYDDTIAGEIRRIQAVYASKPGESHVQAVARHFNITPAQKADGGVKPTAPEPSSDSLVPYAEMTPYIPLPPHEPVPICVVSRAPLGAPTFEAHQAVKYPQNVAFLEAIRGAKETVFIQTPNLNAEPLLPELVKAVRRGIKVEIWVCLGYNDAGELLPYQNGINEMIAHRLYHDVSLLGEGAEPLSDEEKKRLAIYVYVAKDQNIPIHNKFKKRSCHIKLLVADSHIAIQGNGNQDTQTWFHSQEVNIMLDSEDVCRRWMEGIRRNQNTEIYGRVSTDDGCWHNPETGEMAEGAIGVDPGRFSWAKGVIGAVQRVRGAGGF
jgi:phosphatidylserine/phosphatidylglycerophosphate/cardiolipin synthase-like enzyme